MSAYTAKFVNGTCESFWCPACDKEDRVIGYADMPLVVWVNLNHIHVCTYALCNNCFNKGVRFYHTGKMAKFQALQDRCEERLLKRYPILELKLKLTNTPSSS